MAEELKFENENEDLDITCPITMLPFSEEDAYLPMVISPCAHTIGKTALLQLQKTKGKLTCPCCQTAPIGFALNVAVLDFVKALDGSLKISQDLRDKNQHLEAQNTIYKEALEDTFGETGRSERLQAALEAATKKTTALQTQVRKAEAQANAAQEEPKRLNQILNEQAKRLQSQYQEYKKLIEESTKKDAALEEFTAKLAAAETENQKLKAEKKQSKKERQKMQKAEAAARAADQAKIKELQAERDTADTNAQEAKKELNTVKGNLTRESKQQAKRIEELEKELKTTRTKIATLTAKNQPKKPPQTSASGSQVASQQASNATPLPAPAGSKAADIVEEDAFDIACKLIQAARHKKEAIFKNSLKTLSQDNSQAGIEKYREVLAETKALTERLSQDKAIYTSILTEAEEELARPTRQPTPPAVINNPSPQPEAKLAPEPQPKAAASARPASADAAPYQPDKHLAEILNAPDGEKRFEEYLLEKQKACVSRAMPLTRSGDRKAAEALSKNTKLLLKNMFRQIRETKGIPKATLNHYENNIHRTYLASTLDSSNPTAETELKAYLKESFPHYLHDQAELERFGNSVISQIDESCAPTSFYPNGQPKSRIAYINAMVQTYCESGQYYEQPGPDYKPELAVRFYDCVVKLCNTRKGRYHLARCHRDGIGVEKNGAEAIKILSIITPQKKEDEAQRLLDELLDSEISQPFASLHVAIKEGNNDAIAERLKEVSLPALQNLCKLITPKGIQSLKSGRLGDRAWATEITAYAACELGGRFQNGIGVACDHEQAAHFFKVAAEKGLASAQYQLACHHLTKGNNQQAVGLFELAAAQKYVPAMTALGEIHIRNNINKPKGITLLKSASEDADELAYNVLAECYMKGDGVPKNEEVAVRLFKLAYSDSTFPKQNEIKLEPFYDRGIGVRFNVASGLSKQEKVALYKSIVALAAEPLENADGAPAEEEKGDALSDSPNASTANTTAQASSSHEDETLKNILLKGEVMSLWDYCVDFTTTNILPPHCKTPLSTGKVFCQKTLARIEEISANHHLPTDKKNTSLEIIRHQYLRFILDYAGTENLEAELKEYLQTGFSTCQSDPEKLNTFGQHTLSSIQQIMTEEGSATGDSEFPRCKNIVHKGYEQLARGCEKNRDFEKAAALYDFLSDNGFNVEKHKQRATLLRKLALKEKTKQPAPAHPQPAPLSPRSLSMFAAPVQNAAAAPTQAGPAPSVVPAAARASASSPVDSLSEQKADKAKSRYVHQATLHDLYEQGRNYLLGEGGVTRDVSKGVELLTKAATEGLNQAQCLLGVHYFQSTKPSQWEMAIPLLQAAADSGLAEAQYYLGRCHEGHKGQLKKNVPEAVRLYTLSAQQGYHPAQSALGFCCLNGTGIGKNEAKGIDLLQKAAAQENPDAQAQLTNLGVAAPTPQP